MRPRKTNNPNYGPGKLKIVPRGAIAELYKSGASMESIAKRHNVTRLAIRMRLINEGVMLDSSRRRRRYELNESFFENIQTEAQAYVLGFVAADGHCSRYDLRIDLHRKDRDHLGVIANLLGSNAPIYDRMSRGVGRNGIAYSSPLSRIGFCSAKMMADLAALGLNGNKTKTCVPPNLNPSMLRHFFRGLFDGDGSIGRVNLGHGCSPCWQVSLVGNHHMTQGFSEFIASETGIAKPPRFVTKDSIWHVQYMGSGFPRRAAAALYHDACYFLERKHKLYLEMMNIPNIS